jgi:DNA-binding beta-propeller fold protein YncE
MKILKISSFLICILMSCSKNSDDPIESFLTGSGVFILNEGNFRSGNGSLSFYSYDSSKIYNDLFQNINRRPLGDIPNSVQIYNDNTYIIVNNSGKIEVVNCKTLESVATINKLISPRNISFVNNSKAYVTSIYSDSVAIISLTDYSVSGFINLRRSSEAIVVTGDKAFISHWMGGNEIMVVNTLTDKLADSIRVGVEPESMVIDQNKMLWVLCNGGWARDNFAELTVINTSDNTIKRKFSFPTKQASPSCLQIDGKGEILYYLEGGVQRMSVAASTLPVEPLVPESGHYFYKIGINPVNSDIFITDAVDFQQQGYVLYYKKEGTFVSTHKADIIPGSMCFKLNENFHAE